MGLFKVPIFVAESSACAAAALGFDTFAPGCPALAGWIGVPRWLMLMSGGGPSSSGRSFDPKGKYHLEYR